MSTPTLMPPGWYTDPTGRHESRYWDSAHWTNQVSDQGVTATEGPLPTPVGTGFRVVGVPVWRFAIIRIGTALLSVMLVFEAITWMMLHTFATDSYYGTHPPAESTMAWAAWLYHYAGSDTTFASPPPLLLLALVVFIVAAPSLLMSGPMALGKAGLRARWPWQSRGERRRLGENLRSRGMAKSVMRVEVGRRRARVIVSEICAIAVVAVSSYAITAKEASVQDLGARFTGDLTVGLGPKLCLALAILAVLAIPFAWPRRSDRQLTVFADGTVCDVT